MQLLQISMDLLLFELARSTVCGIVGYVGHRRACDVVIGALRRMEYRGYDSAGVALVNGRGTLTVRRRAGRLANLEDALDATDPATLSGHSGVGHTRWATHGRPTDRNAHPHSDAAVKIAVVHNGIIERPRPSSPRSRFTCDLRSITCTVPTRSSS
jgi:glucosamine 6-phosphate synthetase-like amidotransferase/phosphosugar isomerase protein